MKIFAFLMLEMAFAAGRPAVFNPDVFNPNTPEVVKVLAATELRNGVCGAYSRQYAFMSDTPVAEKQAYIRRCAAGQRKGQRKQKRSYGQRRFANFQRRY